MVLLSHQNKRQIKDNLQRLANHISLSITDYLLSSDYPLIETGLENTLLTYKNIYRIQIFKNQRTVASAEREMLQTGLVESTFPVMISPDSNEQLATITITHNPHFNLAGEKPQELLSLVIILIATLLTLLITSYILIHRWLLTPLLQAKKFATDVQSGDLSQRLHHQRNDEIGELFNSLNQMMEKIRNNIYLAQLSTLGEVAVSITHEINNPITVIELQTKSLMKEHGNNSTISPRLEKILSMSKRIGQIVKNTKLMARDGELDKLQAISFQQLLLTVEEIIEYKLSKFNISFTTTIDENIDLLSIKETQIIQVLVNLIDNSIYALKDAETRWIELSANLNLGSNMFIIKVTDSGVGIAPDVAAKIFNTAFTTKSADNGTGFGLSVCQRMVEQHHGRIYLDQSSLHTTFVVEIPRANQRP
jgi:C4-dicarboxylate-specific signal transduction histidine kinase